MHLQRFLGLRTGGGLLLSGLLALVVLGDLEHLELGGRSILDLVMRR